MRKPLRNTFQTLLPASLLFGLTALCLPTNAQNVKDPVAIVKDQDNPARQPVQFTALVSFAAGVQFADVVCPFVVPPNKRLVLEMINGEILVPTGQLILVKLATTSNGVPIGDHALNFSTSIPFTSSQDMHVATLPVRLYADPGTQVRLQVRRNSTTGSSGGTEIAFSGYLVNLP